METKEYFERVLQDYRSTMSLALGKNQHRNGRSLRKYCQDEGIDYKYALIFRGEKTKDENPDGKEA